MKIAFALTVHKPEDDRVWYQQAQALLESGHEVFIISARMKTFDRENVFCFDNTNLSHSEQIDKFCDFLSEINPDIIICDNPVSVLASYKYKKTTKNRQLKIYYDITEYYPSKIHFHHASRTQNVIKFFVLCGVSFYTSLLVSGFIFGEHYKALPYKIFFWKKRVNLAYYADLKHIKTYPVNENPEKFTMFFAGKMKEETGFPVFVNAAIECAKQFQNINFECRVVSTDISSELTKNIGKNLTINFLPIIPFLDFCEKFGTSDIFFDLRDIDLENSHSLPIKLFYYMAAGRPVVYSRLKAIEQGVPEINKFGILVNPTNTSDVVNAISKYLSNKDLYRNHCENARQLAEQKYNWENIKNQFVDFIVC